MISRLCVGSGTCEVEVNDLSINFRRPDPAATICAGNMNYAAGQNSENSLTCNINDTYAEIDVASTDGNIRRVKVRSNGQISVE